jgi:hypothetical protein
MTSLSSGGAMLQRDEENEADVRREDQDKINEFASLNARLHEVRDEKESIKVGTQDFQPSDSVFQPGLMMSSGTEKTRRD